MSLLKQYLYRIKDLMPNMSKLRKEIFLLKLSLDKSSLEEKSQKMEFIAFVFTEMWEKNWRGMKIFFSCKQALQLLFKMKLSL